MRPPHLKKYLRALSMPAYSSRTLSWRLLALLVACNYFAFRTELFESEYNENHPFHYTTSSITLPSLNWETFDKDNAPKAFTIVLGHQIEFLFTIHVIRKPVQHSYQPYQPVRDKSPPHLSMS